MSLSVDPPVFPPKPTLPFLSHGPPMTRIHLYKRAIHLSPWHHHPSLTEKLHHLSIKGHLNEAINLLHQTTINGSKVSSESYLSLIRACTRLKAFTHGCEIHKHMINNMIEPNIVLQNNLTIFYSKGGNLKEARKMFDKMRERNIFSWTTMIGAYCNSGNSEEAYHLFIEMVSTGLRADNFLYPSVFKACGAMRALEQGKRVHSDYIRSGFLWDPVIHNSVIDMYAKCGSIVDARLVYNEMIERDIFTWTTMITSYVQSGNCTAALDIFREMLERETKQNSAAMASILPVFADMGFLEQGKQVHGLIIASGFGFDKFVGSSLIDMYSKCGSIECARYIFDRIIERDIVSWTAMIQGYSQKGLCHESLRLFHQMVENGMNPNWVSWQCIVTQFLERGSVQSVLKLIEHLELASIRPDSSCISVLLPVFAHVTESEQVKLIHGYLKRNGYIYDSYVGSAIIDIYSGFNDLEAAREVFDAISVKYTSSWCSMIACYSKNGYSDQALELFSKMIWSNQTPDQSTMESILSVVSNIDSLEYGKQIHGVLVRTSIEMNKFLESTLINMYGNCGEVNFAFKLFDSMASKDIVSWNAIIGALAKNGFMEEAAKTFDKMGENGLKPNIVTWTTLISGYVHNGYWNEALKLFRELLKEDLRPNFVTISSVLPACSELAALFHGKSIHAHIIRNIVGYSYTFIANALMDMYIKCGLMKYGEQIFARILKKDVVSWNTMIHGYAIHGRGKDALDCFHEMQVQGIEPDSVTFIAVLSACTHTGLVEEGWRYFNQMSLDYGIMPTGKHYACMVDLLGRAGLFDEVEGIIAQMPLEPTASLWGALLASCMNHGNVELAEYAAKNLIELQPQNPGNYVLLSNIYASAGRWKDVNTVRESMANREIKKWPGCSWVEIKNEFHAFTSSGREHPDIEKIIGMLKTFTACMEVEGYVAERLSPLHDVEDEE